MLLIIYLLWRYQLFKIIMSFCDTILQVRARVMGMPYLIMSNYIWINGECNLWVPLERYCMCCDSFMYILILIIKRWKIWYNEVSWLVRFQVDGLIGGIVASFILIIHSINLPNSCMDVYYSIKVSVVT